MDEYQISKDTKELIPAIPPEDYEGSQADWMIGLQTRGLWDGEGWHGDVYISAKDYFDLLEDCESGN